MTTMAPLRDILNDTPADAADVQWNFQTLEGFINSELINRDGSVAMAQPLTLAGPAPSQPNHAAPKSYVDAAFPVGMMVEFAGAAAPTGWALCDGAVKSQTDPAYAALFAVIGTAFNVGGEGTGNFRLPNMKGRFAVGIDATNTAFNTRGKLGGSADAIVASHNHSTSHTLGTGSANADHTHGATHAHSASSGIESQGHIHSTTLDHSLHFYDNDAIGSNVGSGATTMLWRPASSATTGPVSANHTHPITVDSASFSTGGMSANHQHAVTGAVTVNNTGTSATNANLPPYVCLNYIIRIGV